MIAAFATDQIRALSTAQIVALTTSQVVEIETADIAAMTTTQIHAFETADIAAMSTSQINALVSMTPIVLDLDGNGVQTVSASQGVSFDLGGTGVAQQSGWVGRGDGLLAMDLNGDGRINDGRELFGAATELANGQRAGHGFNALAQLDSNGDGVISAGDAKFDQLRVWVDGNGDGVAGDDFVREFGFRLQVSGTTYEDWDGNGVRGPADPVLPGVEVFADLNNNGTRESNEPWAISDGNGFYNFGGLSTGNTVIRQVPKSGYVTSSAATQTVNLATTTSTVANVDFGQIQSAPAVYGRVFNDTNGNGVPDTGETGQFGRVVYVDANNNGTLDSGETQTTTDSLGNYRIPLAAGNYPIRLNYLAGMGATAPANNLHVVDVTTGPVTGKNFGQQPDSVAPTGSVTVGDGSASRSRVESLKVTFSEVVVFTNNDPTSAFTLTKAGAGALSINAAAAVVGGQTIVTITFLSGTEFGSLSDGRYTLTVDATRIRDVALNQVQPIAPTNFHRFFGDVNGDARIDIADFGPFSATYNLSTGQTGFNGQFDFNNDGRIDIADFGPFSVRYFTTLP